VSLLPPVAIFLVRAWFEDGRFLARIVRSTDLQLETSTKVLTTDPNELATQLDIWLHDLKQPPAPPAG
jgi:hypothetical protein